MVAYVRMRGVKVGKNCTIFGMPVLKFPKGASITIGDRTQMISTRFILPTIEAPVRLFCVHSKAKITVGKNVAMGGMSIQCFKSVTIGDNCVLGSSVIINDSNGHIPGPNGTWPSTRNKPEYARPIVIEDSCFIGARVIILKGVTIGKGSVVGGGAVVSKNVPPYHLAYGNPATIVPLPDSWKYKAPEEKESLT